MYYVSSTLTTLDPLNPTPQFSRILVALGYYLNRTITRLEVSPSFIKVYMVEEMCYCTLMDSGLFRICYSRIVKGIQVL